MMKNIIYLLGFLLLIGCDGREVCYTRNMTSTVRSNFVVRADGIQVDDSYLSGGAVSIGGIDKYDQNTGLPVSSTLRGEWQQISSTIENGKSGVIQLWGEVYLNKYTHYMNVDFVTSEKNIDNSGNKVLVKKDDLIVISRYRDPSVKFRSVGGFDDDFVSELNTSLIPAPSNTADFETFFNNNSSDDQKFIKSFGYCREKIPQEAITNFLTNGTSYTSMPLKNCFNYDGIGLQISVGSEVVKDGKLPFMSASAIVAQDIIEPSARKNFELDKNNNSSESTSYFYHMNFDESKDAIINHVIKAPADGELIIKLDQNAFKNAIYFKGGYSIAVNRYTNQMKNGTGLKIIQTPDGINPNSFQAADQIQSAYTNGKMFNIGYGSSSMSFTSKVTGPLWARIDGTVTSSPNPNDRIDQYYGKVSFYNYTAGWTNIYNNFVEPLRDRLTETAQRTYLETVRNTYFQRLVKIMMTLTFIFYSLSFLLGFIKESQTEFVNKIIKFTIVGVLISDNSWSFFNEHLFTIFTYGTDSLMKAIGSNNGAISNIGPFDWMDRLMFMFFQDYLGTRFASFFAFGPFGFILLAAMLYGIFVMVITILLVFLYYCIAMTCTAFMIAIAPLFISFLLFKRTSEMFKVWWKLTGFFAFSPAIIMIGAILITELIDQTASRILGYKNCYQDLLRINLVVLGFIQFTLITIRGFAPRQDSPTSPEIVIPVADFNIGAASPDRGIGEAGSLMAIRTIIDLIIFILLVNLMKTWVKMSEMILSRLIGLTNWGSQITQQAEFIEGMGESFVKTVLGGARKGFVESFKTVFGKKK